MNPATARACRTLLAGALAAGLCAADARAAVGGTDYVFLGAGAGSLRPRQRSTIRLVSEDLTITLGGRRVDAAGRRPSPAQDPGPLGYAVRATYRLSSRGSPQAALYGVPIVVPTVPDTVRPPDRARAARGALDAAEVLASTVRIKVGGVEHRCALQREAPLPPGTAPSDVPAIGATVAELGTELAGFCVAKLALPAGEAAVTVTYAAPLFGIEESPAPRAECAGTDPARPAPECARARPERHGFLVHHPFGGASPWAGRPDRVSFTVDLGGFQVDRPASLGVPEDAGVASGILHWSWNEPRLEERDLAMVVTERGAEETGLRSSNGLSTSAMPFCRLDPADLDASASSFLRTPERSYAAARAVDGNGATAWCASKRPGVGEWIEVSFPSPASRGVVKPYGLYLLPGLAGSQAAYEDSGHVRRIRYGPCGKGAKLTTGEVPARGDVLEAMVKVPGSEAVVEALIRDAKQGEACLRVEIAAVSPGAKGAACISELSLPMRCE